MEYVPAYDFLNGENIMPSANWPHNMNKKRTNEHFYCDLTHQIFIFIFYRTHTYGAVRVNNAMSIYFGISWKLFLCNFHVSSMYYNNAENFAIAVVCPISREFPFIFFPPVPVAKLDEQMEISFI